MWFPLTCLLQAKPQDTLDLCQLLNDDLAATVARHPKRFVGLGTLPMQAPELAVKELQRCVKQLGFPGVQIGSHINEWDLNAQELFPVYAVSKQHWIRGHTARLDTELGAPLHWEGQRKMPGHARCRRKSSPKRVGRSTKRGMGGNASQASPELTK